jgi:signal recognition particle GTPase
MIKKLLRQFFSFFSNRYDKKKIEKYLAESIDLADLENRIKELDKKGAYSKLYI